MLTGGAALVVASSSGLACAETDQPADAASDTSAFGTVTESGPSDRPVRVRVGQQELEVQPIGFPAGWELLVGDRLIVDLEQRVMWPHLQPDPSGDRRAPVFVTVNEDPQLERVFGTSGD